MEKGRIGESYCLTNTAANMRSKDLIEMIGRIAGVEGVATREVSPKVMLRVARLAELWSRITGKPPLTTYKNTMYILAGKFRRCQQGRNGTWHAQSPIEQAIEDLHRLVQENGYV